MSNQTHCKRIQYADTYSSELQTLLSLYRPAFGVDDHCGMCNNREVCKIESQLEDKAAEFSELRGAYLKELDGLQAKYRPAFDHIINQVIELKAQVES